MIRARRTYEVEDSPDLRRIEALPVAGPSDPRGPEILTRYFSRPGNPDTLRPLQAESIVTAVDNRGLLCELAMGAGKTLISLLLPTAFRAARPVLVVPANLRDKTLAEYDDYAAKWQTTLPRIVSYTELGLEQNKDFLERWQPDLLVCDEAHNLKNPRAGVTRRISRYLEARPWVVFCALTGTPVDRSLHDVAHLCRWAFGDRSPLPLDAKVLDQWARAVDPGLGPRKRIDPGKLSRLFRPEDFAIEDPARRAAAAVGRRKRETPGVVSADPPFDGPIEVLPLRPDVSDVQGAIDALKETGELPSGESVLDHKDLSRASLALALGFYYAWDPPAPPTWAMARSAWGRALRVVQDETELDTPMQIQRAVERGLVDTVVDDRPVEEILDRWLAVAPSFEPRPVVRWLSDSIVERTAAWALESPGIVWASHVAFARRVAETAGIPYYGQGGKDEDGNPISRERGDRSVVCSVASNKEGRNLQAFCRNLVVAPPASGKNWGQLVARTHRDGQKRPVTVEVYQTTEEQRKAWRAARRNARFLQEQTGRDQVILFAAEQMEK